MVETIVRELSDGEELVLEGVPARAFADARDPRERTIEVRSLAGRNPARAEERPADGTWA